MIPPLLSTVQEQSVRASAKQIIERSQISGLSKNPHVQAHLKAYEYACELAKSHRWYATKAEEDVHPNLAARHRTLQAQAEQLSYLALYALQSQTTYDITERIKR